MEKINTHRAAVIQSGTTSRQQTVVATLETIDEACKMAANQTAGILIVGDVVSLSEKLDWRPELPLTGKQVLLSRNPGI